MLVWLTWCDLLKFALWTPNHTCHSTSCKVNKLMTSVCYCCDRKSRTACAQSFALWQQATIEFTCHDHSVIACSRHIYVWCCSSRTSRSWWITHLTQHHRRGCNTTILMCVLIGNPEHFICSWKQCCINTLLLRSEPHVKKTLWLVSNALVSFCTLWVTAINLQCC